VDRHFTVALDKGDMLATRRTGKKWSVKRIGQRNRAEHNEHARCSDSSANNIDSFATDELSGIAMNHDYRRLKTMTPARGSPLVFPDLVILMHRQIQYCKSILGYLRSTPVKIMCLSFGKLDRKKSSFIGIMSVFILT